MIPNRTASFPKVPPSISRINAQRQSAAHVKKIARPLGPGVKKPYATRLR
jgi:hypothetical protein